MKTTFIKMSSAYNNQSEFWTDHHIDNIDCTLIESTKCYCDDYSAAKLRELITCDLHGLHFIDSGNYHYLTLFFLEKINEDFNLVLVDHHPDDQPPGFGDILSCGGWVLKAKETLPHLKNIYTYGVNETIPYTDIPTDLPVYLSIDKDALSTDFAITDWDQGDMSLDELLKLLTSVCTRHRLIGVDVCGDTSDEFLDNSSTNDTTNRILFDFFSTFF